MTLGGGQSQLPVRADGRAAQQQDSRRVNLPVLFGILRRIRYPRRRSRQQRRLHIPCNAKGKRPGRGLHRPLQFLRRKLRLRRLQCLNLNRCYCSPPPTPPSTKLIEAFNGSLRELSEARTRRSDVLRRGEGREGKKDFANFNVQSVTRTYYIISLSILSITPSETLVLSTHSALYSRSSAATIHERKGREGKIIYLKRVSSCGPEQVNRPRLRVVRVILFYL